MNTHTHTQSYTCTHTHTHKVLHMHTHSPTHAHAQSYTCTLTVLHTHTHISWLSRNTGSSNLGDRSFHHLSCCFPHGDVDALITLWVAVATLITDADAEAL